MTRNRSTIRSNAMDRAGQDGVRITTTDGVTPEPTVVSGTTAADDQATRSRPERSTSNE